MTEEKVTDEWLGFHEFIGIEDKRWTPEKVKELLRDLIKDNFIFTVDEAVLYSFLLRKGVLNINNRHDDFFNNLIRASRTGGGKTAILKYANSGKDINTPPELSELVTPPPDEDQEIPTDTTGMSISVEEEKQKMPETVEQILRDTLILDSITDDELAIKFYLNYSINRFWKKAFDDEKNTIKKLEAEGKSGNKFHDTAVETFLRDYYAARKLKLPNGYDFRNPQTKNLIQPFLMQLYVAQKIKQEPYFGNFSGTGAGKTLSAILASRVMKSKMTLIICPNDVVNHWNKFIIQIFPDSTVISRKDVFSAKYDTVS